MLTAWPITTEEMAPPLVPIRSLADSVDEQPNKVTVKVRLVLDTLAVAATSPPVTAAPGQVQRATTAAVVMLFVTPIS